MQDLTTQATWRSSTGAAGISNTAGSQGLATGVATGTTTISASVVTSDAGTITGSTGLTVNPPIVQSITVTPSNSSVPAGLTAQYTASALYSDQVTRDITTLATWSSSNTAAATISNAAGSQGLATGVAVGTTTISASYQSVLGSTGLTVTPAVLQSIALTPVNGSVPEGLTLQYTATGHYSDSSTQDLTALANWASSNTAAATISNASGSQGLATGVALGSTTVTASYKSVLGSTGLTVNPAVLQSISITPVNGSVAAGLTLQYTATGHYSDSSTQDLTALASWASSNTAAATLSNASGSQGLATGIAVGTATISASYKSVVGSSGLTVTPAVLQSIALTPVNASLAAGLTLQYTATGKYSDSSTQDLTAVASWASSNTAAATISNDAGSQGLATGVAVGTATISASYQSVLGSTGLTVTPAVLQSISMTPVNGSVAAGLTLQYTATGHYSDSSTQDLTAVASWASSNTAAATISNASGSQGLATGVALGSATISASYHSVVGSTGLAVTAPVLQAIAVSPVDASLPLGLSLQYTATAQYSDRSTQDVSASATWSSSDPTVATISNAAGSLGLASTVATGTVTISATYQSLIGSTHLTVLPPAVQVVTVSPTNSTLVAGSLLTYTAMAQYTDGTMRDRTNTCTWSSSNAQVATIGNSTPGNAQASALANGSTNISAACDGVVGTTSLAVGNISAFSPSLLGMSINYPNFSPLTIGMTAWPTVPFAAFRLWDNGVAWHQLQPTASSYVWDPLNGWLTFLSGHGITDIIYTFGSTPTWASSNPTDTTCKYGPGTCYPPYDLNPDGTGPDQLWISFVTALAQQALGKIKYYQLWDTPKDVTHWKGTDAQLVRMSQDAYQAIKSVDPTAQVLSPPSGAYHIAATNTCSIANREKPFFAAGGGPYVDIISFNGYIGTAAEDLVPALQCLKTMLASYQQQGKPLWDTEGSWGTSTDLADTTQQAAFLVRSYLLQVSQNVQRFYWYAWNNRTWGTLWDKNTGIHPAGKAYRQVYSWLIGATLAQPCTLSGSGIWTCVLIRPNGYQALAVWVTGAPQSYTAPLQYISSRDIFGVKTAITSGATLTVSTLPILLENQ